MLGVAVSVELFVSEEFVVWLWTLDAFSRWGDLFDGLDCNVKLSGFVPATHVRIEALKSMLLLESSNLLREMEKVSSLSEIPSDLKQLDFAHQ